LLIVHRCTLLDGLFKKNKVTYVKGWGSLSATPGEVTVTKEDGTTVGRCWLKPVEPRVECAWCQRLKPKYDEPLSNFTFKFNLRRYSTEMISAKNVILATGSEPSSLPGVEARPCA